MSELPPIQRPAVATAATAGAAMGGIAVGAGLGHLLCPGEAGLVIGAVAFLLTFGAGYGMWSAYALAQAHVSLFRLIFLPWLRRRDINRDREAWRAEFAAMWEKALRKSFLFWLNALWVGTLGALGIALCALGHGPLGAAVAMFAGILAYGIVLARLARRGYLALPEE